MRIRRRKKKVWFTREWFSGFSANILGVVIGIALTFGITFLVQHRQERKQTREMVALLRREIADNKDWLADRAKVWQRDFNAYWVVLWEQDWNTLPKDSLDAAVKQIRTETSPSSTSYMWDMFVSSGMLQKLHDVELAAALSECYHWTEETRRWWAEYRTKKEVCSALYRVEYVEQPLDYFRALKEDKDSRAFMEDVGRFNAYGFPQMYEQLAPVYDYVLFLLDNFDKPRKTKDIDFPAFKKMQEEEQNKAKK